MRSYSIECDEAEVLLIKSGCSYGVILVHENALDEAGYTGDSFLSLSNDAADKLEKVLKKIRKARD